MTTASPLRASHWLDDWYVLDRYHTAQPEGTAADWREIIRLIREGKSGSGGRRVGLAIDQSGQVHFFSPRNSVVDSEAVLCPSEIDGWIAKAEALLDSAEQVVADGGGI